MKVPSISYPVQSEEYVRFYMEQHLWRPLEKYPTPPPFSQHQIWQYGSVGGPKGDLDWVVVGYSDGSDPQVLFAVAARSTYKMPVPEGWTLAAMYANDAARPYIQDALHHAYGYMQSNQLRYTVIVTGEVYSFLEREGNVVRVADVHGHHDSAHGVLRRWLCTMYCTWQQSLLGSLFSRG